MIFTDATGESLDLKFVQGLNGSGSIFCSIVNCMPEDASVYGAEAPPFGFLATDVVLDSTSMGIVTPVAATPEPSSLMLLGTGVLTIGGTVRRRLLRS